MQIKGTCSRKGEVDYSFFLPETLYSSSITPFENRTTIFKPIILGKEQFSAGEKMENKQKNATFFLKRTSYLSFVNKLHYVCYCHETMFINKDVNEWFQLY